MSYDQTFFEKLRDLVSDPASDLAFRRPEIDFEKFGLEVARCHTNVERWIAQHPTFERVRGWLVSPAMGELRFYAHSLAEGPDGDLIDVTPYEDIRMRNIANRFVRHPGSNEEFDRGVRERWGQEGAVADPELFAQAMAELSNRFPYAHREDEP